MQTPNKCKTCKRTVNEQIQTTNASKQIQTNTNKQMNKKIQTETPKKTKDKQQTTR